MLGFALVILQRGACGSSFLGQLCEFTCEKTSLFTPSIPEQKRLFFFFSTPLARLTNKMLSLEKGRHTYINKLIYKTNQEANIAEEKEELQVTHGGGRVEKVTTEDEKGH